jgi:hypothetical protein
MQKNGGWEALQKKFFSGWNKNGFCKTGERPVVIGESGGPAWRKFVEKK